MEISTKYLLIYYSNDKLSLKTLDSIPNFNEFLVEMLKVFSIEIEVWMKMKLSGAFVCTMQQVQLLCYSNTQKVTWRSLNQ